ncbi:hypothetical protein LCGC14_1291670, partial [marine sediment metagenome]
EYKVLKNHIDGRKAELKRIKDGTWQAPIYGEKQKVSKYLPSEVAGDEMPGSAGHYLSTGTERVYGTMEHEFAHHIHQQMFFTGQPYSYYDPPLEKWLDTMFARNKIATTRNTLSTYSQKDGTEWFAENYSIWKNGSKGLVHPELRGLMEALDDLEAGKLTQKQLFKKLFPDGDIVTGRTGGPLSLLAPKAMGKYPLANQVSPNKFLAEKEEIATWLATRKERANVKAIMEHLNNKNMFAIETPQQLSEVLQEMGAAGLIEMAPGNPQWWGRAQAIVGQEDQAKKALQDLQKKLKKAKG